MTHTEAPATVTARFGKSGTVTHLAHAAEVVNRFGRATKVLTSSVPVCGTSTKPGSGWIVGGEVTCTKCLAAS